MLDRSKVVLYAASTRLVLGVVGIALLPLLYPRMSDHRLVFGIYLAVALFFQFLIWKQVGGMWRSTIAGVIDLLLLTYIVHRVGSVGTMLVSVYFFAAIMNTLVVGRRVGLALAAVAGLFYSTVVGLETSGYLPYGPDSPAWAVGEPGPREGGMAAILLSLLVLASSAVVGMLVNTNRLRERQLLDANRRLEQLSQRDPLTQLYHRRHLLACIERELSRVRRGALLSVVMIDLDRFKRVNDQHGHHAGDELLEQLARTLSFEVREADIAGRYGGDEFVVVLPDTDAEQALAAAERIVAAVRRAGRAHDAELPVTASVGVAAALPEDDALTLLRRADSMAYRAKEAGGDRAMQVA